MGSRVAECAPGRIRTCDLRIRNPLLYPAELRERGREFTRSAVLGKAARGGREKISEVECCLEVDSCLFGEVQEITRLLLSYLPLRSPPSRPPRSSVQTPQCSVSAFPSFRGCYLPHSG